MGRVNLINPQTGKAESFPDDEAALGAAFAKGYKAESTEAEIDRAAREGIVEGQAGGKFGAVKAVAEGFKRGATFGLSDVAGAMGGNEGQREYQAALREKHGALVTAGEVGGALLPALLTGGSSAAASGTSTARAVGSSALRYGAEGAAQNTGMYLSDVALGNKQLSAEGFLASAGTGAALGGGVGGGLVAAERGFIKARSLFPKTKATESAVREAADNVDVELQKALTAGDDSVRKAKDQLEVMRLQNAELDNAAKARVLEKRAAEAAKAQAAADLQAQKLATQRQLDEVRIAKAKEPKTHRPGSKGKTRSPVGQKADDVIAQPQTGAAPTYESVGVDVVDATLPPEALANRIELPGVGDDAVKLDKSRKIVSEGELTTDVPDPIRLAVHPDGRYEVIDGRNRIAAAIEQGKPVRAKVERAYVPKDDVVGAPIGSTPPLQGDDLESLLAQSTRRLRAGESAADLAKQAKVPSALDEIHEAMAELDPNAARIVEAVKATETNAANLQRRFKVRAPQEIGGSTTAQIADAPNLTLGRVKQMYEKANDAEKLALLDAIGPEKAKALEAIVSGKASFAKWYKNKGHWWDDPSYGPLPKRPGPSPDDLGEFADMRAAASVADDDLAHVMSMTRAAEDIGAYERSVHDLAVALGPDAPPSAMEIAARYGAAVDDQARKVSQRTAQALDDAPLPAAPGGSWGEARALAGSVPAPDVVPTSATSLSDALVADAAPAAQTRTAAELISLPGAPAAAGKAKPKTGALGMLADLGAAGEAMQAVGIAVPFMPDVDKLPVIGPVLGAYLKMRAGMTVLGKAGFKIPLTGEARVAAGAAATRDRVAQSMDRILSIGEKTTRAVRPVVASQAWRANDVLKSVLFDDGQKRKPKNVNETVKARSEELLAAQENPAAVAATVRQQLADVRDPDLVAAVVDAKQRQLAYLAKHAPLPPPPTMLTRAQVVYSPAQIESFARRVRAVNDPVSVLDDVRTGRITPEGAETLREVYPQLYAEAQERLMQQSMTLNRSLPHSSVVRLSVLFDVPLASTLEPDAVAQIQAAGAQPAPPPTPAMGGLQPSPSGGAPQVASLYMTPGEKRASR